MSLTPDQIAALSAELRAKAEAATPGPWAKDSYECKPGDLREGVFGIFELGEDDPALAYVGPWGESEANAAYIAAANPAAILSLLSALDTLAAELKAAEASATYGWIYLDPHEGVCWSEKHPIKDFGPTPDAEDVRPATAKMLAERAEAVIAERDAETRRANKAEADLKAAEEAHALTEKNACDMASIANQARARADKLASYISDAGHATIESEQAWKARAEAAEAERDAAIQERDNLRNLLPKPIDGKLTPFGQALADRDAALKRAARLEAAALEAMTFIGKAQGTCLGVALSGSAHPDPDGALRAVFDDGQIIAKKITAALEYKPND